MYYYFSQDQGLKLNLSISLEIDFVANHHAVKLSLLFFFLISIISWKKMLFYGWQFTAHMQEANVNEPSFFYTYL